MALPGVYRAIIQDQQRQLAELVRSAGVGPIRRMYEDMLEEVARALRQTASGTFTETQLRGMMAQLRLGMAGIVREMGGRLGDAAYRVGLAAARSSLENLALLERTFAGAFTQLPILEIARLRGLVADKTSSLLRFHRTSTARYGVHLIGRFELSLQAALATGKTGHEAIDAVMSTGEMEWWQAERIVRTELAYAGNASIKVANDRQAEELGGDLWSRWSEHVDDAGNPLDDRVGVDSEAMHGQVAPPGGVFTQPPRSPRGEAVQTSLVGRTWDHPPNRPNDRSVLTPWRAHWEIPGWIWENGRRVPVTQAMADAFSDTYERRSA